MSKTKNEANSIDDSIDNPAIYEQDGKQTLPRVGMIVKAKKKKPSISFSDTPEKIKEIREFAVDKGFGKASVLLKYAVYQYMRRYAKHGP